MRRVPGVLLGLPPPVAVETHSAFDSHQPEHDRWSAHNQHGGRVEPGREDPSFCFDQI